jgi:predicted nucleotidyltransferase
MTDQDQIKFNRSLSAYLLNREYPDSPDFLLGLWKDLCRSIASKKSVSPSLPVSFKGDFDYADFKDSKLNQKYAVINFLKEEINRELGTFIKTFFLQGSFGEGNALENWSDLDVMIIFNEKLFKSRENLIFARQVLRRFSLLFYKIDPLNHHRFHLATSLDLNYYPQSFLPLAAFRDGLWLAGEKEFEVKVRDDAFEKTQDLLGRAKHFKKRVQFLPENLTEFKLDLSHLFLLPSILLQIKDIYLPKRLSFERAKKKFPKLDFSVIDEASALREKWQTLNLVKHYPNWCIRHLPDMVNNLAVMILAAPARKKKIPIADPKLRDFIQRSSELYEAACQLKI